MAEVTAIEWTDATWNPITGCSIVSPGCTNCYAMKLAGTRLKNLPSRVGLTRKSKAGPVWTGEIRFNEAWLNQPLLWSRPRMILVCAHGDLFAPGVTDAMIDRVFATMALGKQHIMQVLTKRADRMRAYVTDPATVRRVWELVCDMVLAGAPNCGDVVLIAPGMDERMAPPGRRVKIGTWPLRNVWLGISAEDQRRADERVPILLDTPAAVRWVSAEPLLGSIDFRISHCPTHDFDSGFCVGPCPDRVCLDWIVAGGESGHGARPMNPSWVRAIRDQCAAAGVAFLFKQWGEHLEADQLFDRSARSDSAWIMRDRKRWDPQRPLNFTDAAWLGDFLKHRYEHHSDGSTYYRLGKGRTGRLLDGVTHDGFPEARP